MLIKRPADVRPSEITPRAVYEDRRRFLRAAGGLAAGAALAPLLGARRAFAADAPAPDWPDAIVQPGPDWLQAKVHGAVKGPFDTDEKVAPWQAATSYNNFYEFGTDKGDPAKYASSLTTTPWSVTVDGEVDKPGPIDLEDLIAPHRLQERIYRHRCVEAWSMVIPWVGFPLADLLRRVAPNSKAKYVAFTTLYRPSEMRGQGSYFATIDYPYVEGLRLDEAMHPLTLMTVGMYGEVLPNQNGAPLRLIVPWKYGFKGIKSIVRISLTRQRPKTTWNQLAPNEYGFYANVNPNVDHPRWSQATERRLPSTLFDPNRRDTLMFNGYGEQVAQLYAGMDLKRNF